MAKERLGFLGIGRMGAPIAGRLIDAGHELVVFDTRREVLRPLVARGATAAASPHEVADAATIVLTSLPTPDSSSRLRSAPTGWPAARRSGR